MRRYITRLEHIEELLIYGLAIVIDTAEGPRAHFRNERSCHDVYPSLKQVAQCSAPYAVEEYVDVAGHGVLWFFLSKHIVS